MTLAEFGTIVGCHLRMEPIGKACRCYFPGVMFAAPEGQDDVDVSVIGAGPNQQRAREDFVQKIQGKVARTYDGRGSRSEFPVPALLKP